MKAFLYLALSILGSSLLSARTWTSADGRTLEAEMISATDDSVTIKTSAGKAFTLAFDKISEADREFVKSKADEMAEKAKAEASLLKGDYAKLVTGDWVLETHGDLPYAFYGGSDLDTSVKHPLVVVLHGKSSNNENGKQIGFAKKFADAGNYGERPCLIFSPLCYQPHGGTGGGWNDAPGVEALELIEELVDELPLVDPDRIYVIGYSMGGFGTWHFLGTEPKLFAAGVPVAGGSNGKAAGLKKVPIWCFHGADDKVVPASLSQRDAEALDSSKVFKYTEYPGEGHGVIGKVVGDPEMHTWLFQQTRAK